MTSEVHDMIVGRIDDLQKHVDRRFDVVEKKQDITNGRVNALEAERDKGAGYAKRVHEEREHRKWWVSVLTSPLTSVVVFCAGVIAARYLPT